MAMTGDNAIAPLGALVLGGLEIAGKVRTTATLATIYQSGS
jgi:hypothetical protein